MGERILITGGAGFIGSHLADELLACGHHVRVLDPLIEQVHGSAATRPAYLHPDVEFIPGDVRDAAAVRRVLAGVDAVYHFAARVGVGQSMYEIAEYTSVNTMGTAVLLEALMDQRQWPVTCSIGAVTYHSPPESIDQMLQAADQVMYNVKQTTKNQIAIVVIDENTSPLPQALTSTSIP